MYVHMYLVCSREFMRECKRSTVKERTTTTRVPSAVGEQCEDQERGKGGRGGEVIRRR